MATKTQVTVTTPVFFMMFVVFLTLKLAGVIAWSWWLVTLPLWIVPAIVLAFFLFCLILAGLGAILGGFK